MRPFLLLLLSFFIATTVFAQEHRDEFGAQTDNDSYLFNKSDKYYTNGFFLFFRRALPVKGHDSSSLQNKVLGFELGQKMYNAQGGAIPLSIYVDRPFAGYLYAAGTLNLLYKNESNIKLSAQFGVVGPASLADVTQEWIHNTFGLYKINGWQFQIKNAAQVNLSMEYNRLLARESFIDVSLTSYANLGNGFTGAGAGPLLRVGSFNQLFHSQSTQSNVIVNDNIKPLHQQELFLYYKPQINWVAYDATVEGGLGQQHADQNALFITGEVVRTPEPFVFSQQIGAVYSAGRFTFDASVIFDTKEVKQMIAAHQWGAVQGFYRFK